MSLQAVFIVFILSTFNFSFANCIPNPLQKSELRVDMPENTKMSWRENGGMLPAWKSIEISENQILFEVKDSQEDEPKKWSVEIPLEEKKKLYKVFVENKFDTIENDENDEIIYDAGSEGVYIRAGKVSKNISYGPNSPLSGLNKSRYSAVAKAIKELESKYKNQAKELDANFVIIDYDVKKHNYIFENAKRTTLTNAEIDKFNGLLEKAVNEYNKKEGRFRTKDLSEYKLQLLPVLNQKNEKEVYVNAFCSIHGENWREEIIEVDDGGNCYFQLYLNLTQNSYRGFSVNGEA